MIFIIFQIAPVKSTPIHCHHAWILVLAVGKIGHNLCKSELKRMTTLKQIKLYPGNTIYEKKELHTIRGCLLLVVHEKTQHFAMLLYSDCTSWHRVNYLSGVSRRSTLLAPRINLQTIQPQILAYLTDPYLHSIIPQPVPSALIIRNRVRQIDRQLPANRIFRLEED